MVEFNSNLLVVFLATFICLFCSQVTAQGLPAGVTPEMVREIQNLSPAQQQALAQQYGIRLPDVAVQPATQGLGLGDVGEPLEPLVGSETQTEGRDNTDISEMDADQPLPLYGQFLFDQAVSTIAPTDDAPVPDEYRLGVGDQLVIQLFGKENDTYTLLVGRDGNITFPRLGTITVLGLTCLLYTSPSPRD